MDVPSDLQGFLLTILRRWGFVGEEAEPVGEIALTRIWRAVNAVRVIGPAPVLDMVKTIREIENGTDFLHAPDGDEAMAYLDGFYMYLLPMLDGILRKGAVDIAAGLIEALGLTEDGQEGSELRDRLVASAV